MRKRKIMFLITILITLSIYFTGCFLIKVDISKIFPVILDDVEFGTEFIELVLPNEIKVTLSDGAYQQIPVIWNENDYKNETIGDQIITGEFDLSNLKKIINPENTKAIAVVKVKSEKSTYELNDVIFDMRLVPSATFPTGNDNDVIKTIDKKFWMADTTVTYELWYEVRDWAEKNGYIFANLGLEGSVTGGGTWPYYINIGNTPSDSKKEPVTMITWRDAIIWCNAISEILELEPVYRDKDTGLILRTTEYDEISCPTDNIVQSNNNGFRLPTEWEWELAARFIGTERPPFDDLKEKAIYLDGLWWTPGNYASGLYNSFFYPRYANEVAWFSGSKTSPVGKLRSNQLSIYDMSGNVWEWCYNKWDESTSDRVLRGGSWGSAGLAIRVAFRTNILPTARNIYTGFRIVKNFE